MEKTHLLDTNGQVACHYPEGMTFLLTKVQVRTTLDLQMVVSFPRIARLTVLAQSYIPLDSAASKLATTTGPSLENI